MKICAIIPARYQSSRLPGKPLLKIGNKTIIQRTYLQTLQSKRIDYTLVVTDDERIMKSIEEIDGNVLLSPNDCLNGTERICHILDDISEEYDIIVNVQGDEPFIDPKNIDFVIDKYLENQNCYDMVCTTIHNKITNLEDLTNRNIGKLILDRDQNIVYCSRAMIPHTKTGEYDPQANYYAHIGVFVFKREYLKEYIEHPNTPAMLTEDIEWLKIIEMGYRIKSFQIENDYEIGVNTQEEYNYLKNKYEDTLDVSEDLFEDVHENTLQTPEDVHENTLQTPEDVHENTLQTPENVHENTLQIPEDVHENTLQTPEDIHENTLQTPEDVHENTLQTPENVHENTLQTPEDVHENTLQTPKDVHENILQTPENVHENILQIPENVHKNTLNDIPKNIQKNTLKDIPKNSKVNKNISKQNNKDTMLAKPTNEYIYQETRNMYWYNGNKDNINNFGDLVGPYLYQKITGLKPIHRFPKNTNEPVQLTVGSIIHIADNNSIIWGSGMISKTQPIKQPLKIYSVRGPLTRMRLMDLGIKCPPSYGDPALLLPRFINPSRLKKYEVGLIPHYVDYWEVKDLYANRRDILIIDMIVTKENTIEKIIKQICKCRRTISSSLHGIIVSHAYNIPCAWVEFTKNIYGDGIKYLDYYRSVNIKKINKSINLIGKKALTMDELIKTVRQTPQPNFPIKTYKIALSCPFSKGSIPPNPYDDPEYKKFFVKKM